MSCSISHPVGKHIPVSKHDNEMRAYCVRIAYVFLHTDQSEDGDQSEDADSSA